MLKLLLSKHFLIGLLYIVQTDSLKIYGCVVLPTHKPTAPNSIAPLITQTSMSSILQSLVEYFLVHLQWLIKKLLCIMVNLVSEVLLLLHVWQWRSHNLLGRLHREYRTLTPDRLVHTHCFAVTTATHVRLLWTSRCLESWRLVLRKSIIFNRMLHHISMMFGHQLLYLLLMGSRVTYRIAYLAKQSHIIA